MKILNVSIHYLPVLGGQQTYIENLNRVFSSAGHHPFVLQKFSPGAQENVKMVRHIPKLNRFIDSWFLFNWQLRLYRQFIKKFDVVISHYPFHFPSLKWHQRLIVLSHGLDWHIPPASRADQYREKTARMVTSSNALVVANDTHFLRHLGLDVEPASQFFECVSPNCWFIPNCVDTERFYDKGNLREEIILVPRTVRPERGIHLAIEAFPKVLKENPNFKMHIVGQYDEKSPYYTQCLQLITKYRLEKKIKFFGGVQWEKLVDYYNSAMLTLVPTVEMEGTSLSALESMACGTPTVSTNAGGLCDLPTIKGEIHAEDLADKIKSTLKTSKEVGEFQQKEVRKTFNLENWGNAWLKAIHSFRK